MGEITLKLRVVGFHGIQCVYIYTYIKYIYIYEYWERQRCISLEIISPTFKGLLVNFS